MTIYPMKPYDLDEWVTMALKLWPDHSRDEMKRSMVEVLKSDHQQAFMVRDYTDAPIAFMNLSLRFDYVPGATRSPAAYIEGIFVEEAHRSHGIARQLIQKAEEWAAERHCTELASDTLLENPDSQQFHLRTGFREVERVVAFIKTVE